VTEYPFYFKKMTGMITYLQRKAWTLQKSVKQERSSKV